VYAFVRHKGGTWVVAAAPLRPLRSGGGTITLPSRAPTQWWNAFTGAEITARDGKLGLRSALEPHGIVMLSNARLA
jgi:hypothetical protein